MNIVYAGMSTGFFPHADVIVDDTSNHEHAATHFTIVLYEEPVKLVGVSAVERGLQVRNTVEGLHVFENVIIQTGTRHGQLGVTKKSEAIFNWKGCYVL